MTPAIQTAKRQKIDFQLHEYQHDPGSSSYGEEAAEKLAVPAAQVFKTLLVDVGNKQLAVGIVPVTGMLNLKQIAKACKAKKAVMAQPDDVQRVTGYVLGGVSPLGQKKSLPTVLDASAQNFETIYVSAGRRGLDMELTPQDLLLLTRGQYAPICE